MNNLQIFNYNGNEVRTIQKDGEPWWVLKDVCGILGISKYRDTASRLDEDERGSVRVDTPGGEQEMTVVNESGLYNVILRSDKPEAKPFRKWVTSEVLPSIRKHGAYMTPQKIEEVLLNPDTIIKLATELKAEQEKRVALESKVEQDKPLVAFANSVSVAKTSILVGELAKLLKQNGVDMGQNRLFAWMRENGYLISRKGTDYNMPTQRSMEMELFEIKLTTISHGDGHTSISKTPKVTGKGQIYFINLFLGTQQNTDKGAS
jgi:anti-repressor protein